MRSLMEIGYGPAHGECAAGTHIEASRADEDNEDEWIDYERRLIGLARRMRVKEKEFLEAS